MALSPNYGFPEPDNSSLVKNGAQDIRALGDAIDTFLIGGVAFAAAKNAIINGNFAINQRSFTSTTSSGDYGHDRWVMQGVDGTTTYSSQSFTPGDSFSPTASEGTSFARLVSTGQTLASAQSRLTQRIEDVRTFANKTVTVSFWAKASTGTPSIATNFSQNFGSGGSSSVTMTGQKFAITSSWVRYSKTFTISALTGKTIGAGSFLNFNLWISAGSDNNTSTNSLGIQSITVDFWGVQIEIGNQATPFQTATGTIQGELAACQRYLPVISPVDNLLGYSFSTTGAIYTYKLPVTARVKPTGITVTNLAGMILYNGTLGSSGTPTAFTFNTGGVNVAVLNTTTTAGSPTLTAGQGCILAIGAGSVLFTGCEL